MGYTLRAGVSFCTAGDRSVFLDLQQDRYFCLGTQAEAAFAKLIAGGALSACDQQSLQPLLRSGALQYCQSDVAPQACRSPLAASSSILDSIGQHPDIHRLPGVFYALVSAKRDLRIRPLSEVVKDVADRKTAADDRSSKHSLDAIEAVAATFRWFGLIRSQHDQCLWRSVAMARYLLRLGYRPDLIFGVGDRPFGAHCWVQHGEIVLNDWLDNIRPFTPILVV